MDVKVRPKRKLSAEEMMVLNCGVGRRLLRIPWTARRPNQSIPKEINPEYSLEALMLNLSSFSYKDANPIEMSLHSYDLTSEVVPVIKNPPTNAGDTRDRGSIPGSGRSLEMEMATTPVFLPGKSHGQRHFMAYSPWVAKS